MRFDNLHGIAAGLGADVPVCLASQAARMEGIGDILRPAPVLPPCGILLVNPGVAVPTPTVFKSRQGAFSPPATLPARWPTAAAMAADLSVLTNDLQAPAIALQPVIGEVLATLTALPGALLARMSGSGATCFALFPHRHGRQRRGRHDHPAKLVALGWGTLRAPSSQPMSAPHPNWDVAKR